MVWKSKDDKATYDAERRVRRALTKSECKLAAGCMDCGYDEHPAGLEFDHTSPRKGGPTVSSLAMGAGRKRFIQELVACDVVCGTCHNLRTFHRRSEA